MKPEKDYLRVNRESWNNRLEAHLTSEFYDVAGFMGGKSSLNGIELKMLGDVNGKDILHLQCHFGQDSISLARAGARVSGVDLSDKAIAKALELSKEFDIDTEFICSDVYDFPRHRKKLFDIVFTSYGTIGWLPDLNRWAEVISGSLKPGGRFVFVEFHPVLWMFDDNFSDIQHSYFNTVPIIESNTGTYVDNKSNLSLEEISWNHSTSEVLNSLISNGLEILSFDEFDYSPYACFKNVIEDEPGKFRIARYGKKLPMLFAVDAVKT